METKEELEARKEKVLKAVSDAYYDMNSNHYKDNEHYSWAVKTIIERVNEDIEGYFFKTQG